MRILVNGLAANGGGSNTYLRCLLPALAEIRPGNEYVVLGAPWQSFWDFDIPENVNLELVASHTRRSTLQRVAWEQVVLPRVLKKRQIDLLFCPTDIAPLAARCPTVLAIRNPNPYLGGNLRRGLRYHLSRKVLLKNLTRLSAKKAARVVFVSDFSRRVVCSQLGISATKAQTIHHGLNPIFKGVKKGCGSSLGPVPRPYLLAVSNITAHKNFPFLARVFVRMAADPAFRHHFAIAGASIFQRDADEIRVTFKNAGLEDRLHLLGDLSYESLPGLYRNADVFVLPSLLETFGHPLVEAMASGVPIVASNSTCIPEICGEAAEYFNPKDEAEARKKISSVIHDAALKRMLRERAFQRAKRFCWKRSASSLVELFEAAVG